MLVSRDDATRCLLDDRCGSRGRPPSGRPEPVSRNRWAAVGACRGRPLSACRPDSHFVVSVSMLCLLAVPDRSAPMAAVRPRHGAGALAPAGRFCLRAPMRTGGGRPGSPQAPSPDRARTGLPAYFLNLAAEFVAGIAVTPQQVDDDPGGFPAPEMSVSAAARSWHSGISSTGCGSARCRLPARASPRPPMTPAERSNVTCTTAHSSNSSPSRCDWKAPGA